MLDPHVPICYHLQYGTFELKVQRKPKTDEEGENLTSLKYL